MEEGTWRWSKEKILQDKELLIAKTVKRGEETVWDIFQKDYFDRDGTRRTKAKSIWDDSEINYQNGTIEIKTLFQKSGVFDYSKPVYLIEKIMKMLQFESSDIILDFFSGSATTAHSIMQLNSEDGGNRKYIMVQVQEETAEDSEAYKAGYKNICEIGKERIRRAGKKIKEDSPLTTENLDIGFRVLKIDSTNMEDVYYSPDHFDTTDLFKSNIKSDRTPEDLLFQVMLDLGIMLSGKIETKKIDGKTVYYVEGNYLVACFDENVDEKTITAIAKEKPYYFVMRDASYANDSVATNFEQIFVTYSPETVRRVI